MNAGIVDDYLDRPRIQNHLERVCRLGLVRDVELHRLRRAALGDDGARDGLGPLQIAVSVDDDVETLTREIAAYRTADSAASTRHDCSPFVQSEASFRSTLTLCLKLKKHLRQELSNSKG